MAVKEKTMHPNSFPQNQAPRQKFARHSVVDHQNGGMVASTFDYPSDWQAHSQVAWNMEHTELPALIHAVTFNPNGLECFEFLPMQVFFWLEGDFGTVPIGHLSHGLVRMPPRPAPEALANLVIPHLRPEQQDLRVTAVQAVPNLWHAFNDPPPPQGGEGVMARVEYEVAGRPIEEEFYGVYSWNQQMQLNWGFARLCCFRAERGKLDAERATFWQIAASLRPNPQWQQRHDQIAQQLLAGFMVRINETYARLERERQQSIATLAHSAQLRAARDAQVAESVARTHREIGERSQPHMTRQEQFGNLLRDQTLFEDPSSNAGNPHVMQGHAKYVWTDNLGTFYSTDNPAENPNHDRPGHWVLATPVR
jgi:hypothetical protein